MKVKNGLIIKDEEDTKELICPYCGYKQNIIIDSLSNISIICDKCELSYVFDFFSGSCIPII